MLLGGLGFLWRLGLVSFGFAGFRVFAGAGVWWLGSDGVGWCGVLVGFARCYDACGVLV